MSVIKAAVFYKNMTKAHFFTVFLMVKQIAKNQVKICQSSCYEKYIQNKIYLKKTEGA